jgi:putative membrane protein
VNRPAAGPSAIGGRIIRFLPWLLAAATVGGQILWILASPQGRVVLTIATVTTFFLASASHAAIFRGPRWAGGYLAIALGLGWLAEAVGTATGQPFGSYSYSEQLGWRLGAVPLVIPMAWAMMAYPCLLAARVLAGRRVAAVLVGGWLFASWDLFLDPQMVGEGYWNWDHVGTALPGIAEIPTHNFIGWFVVAVILMAALTALPHSSADDRVPNFLLSWTYVGSIAAAAVFLGRPAVAAWGALAMGVVIVPWWLRLARGVADQPAPAGHSLQSRGHLR